MFPLIWVWGNCFISILCIPMVCECGWSVFQFLIHLICECSFHCVSVLFILFYEHDCVCVLLLIIVLIFELGCSCFSLHTPDLWMCLFIHLICKCVCHVSFLFCWSPWFLNVSDMCQFCFVYLHDLWMCLTCVSFALFISIICECGCFIMFQFCSSRKSCHQTAETLVKRSWGHSSFVLPQFRQDITAAANRIKERKLSGRCALMQAFFVVMSLLHSLWYKHHGWLGIQNQLFIQLSLLQEWEMSWKNVL